MLAGCNEKIFIAYTIVYRSWGIFDKKAINSRLSATNFERIKKKAIKREFITEEFLKRKKNCFFQQQMLNGHSMVFYKKQLKSEMMKQYKKWNYQRWWRMITEILTLCKLRKQKDHYFPFKVFITEYHNSLGGHYTYLFLFKPNLSWDLAKI